MARAKKTKRTFSFSPKQIKTAERSVILLLVVFVAVMLMISLRHEAVWEHFSSLPVSLWASLLGLSIVNYAGRGIKWPLFARRVGIHIPAHVIGLYYTAGMAMTVTPGKLGTALRLWLMQKGHQTPYERSLPLMIMDPVVDLASLFVLTLAGAVAFGAGHMGGIATFGVILMTCLGVFACPNLGIYILKNIYRLIGKKHPRIFVSVIRMLRRLTQLVTAKLLVQVVGLSLIGWGATIYAFDLILSHMGADISFLAAAFVFSFSTILGGAAMTPGGLGGTEASMVLLLMALGVPTEIALAATVVIRTTTLWFGVLIGFTFLPAALKTADKSAH